jgi:hypothetical protein
MQPRFLRRQTEGDGRTQVPVFGFIEIEEDYFSDTIILWTRFDHNLSARPFSCDGGRG